MTRKILTAAGACCVIGLLVAGFAVFALFAAFRNTSAALAPASRKAVAFSTAVGEGADDRAYGMLSADARRGCPMPEFAAKAAEARKALGRFRAEQPASVVNVNLQVHNSEWRYSTTIPLQGENARGIASIDMIRGGRGPWQIRNWACTRADAR